MRRGYNRGVYPHFPTDCVENTQLSLSVRYRSHHMGLCDDENESSNVCMNGQVSKRKGRRGYVYYGEGGILRTDARA